MDEETKQIARALYREFVRSRGLCGDGFCPQCDLADERVEMYLNYGDLFECPRCHLMVSLSTPGMATIPRRRGNGRFKPFTPYYAASNHIENVNLSREDSSRQYDSDGSFLGDRKELESYLGEVEGVDPYV